MKCRACQRELSDAGVRLGAEAEIAQFDERRRELAELGGTLDEESIWREPRAYDIRTTFHDVFPSFSPLPLHFTAIFNLRR